MKVKGIIEIAALYVAKAMYRSTLVWVVIVNTLTWALVIAQAVLKLANPVSAS